MMLINGSLLIRLSKAVNIDLVRNVDPRKPIIVIDPRISKSPSPGVSSLTSPSRSSTADQNKYTVMAKGTTNNKPIRKYLISALIIFHKKTPTVTDGVKFIS